METLEKKIKGALLALGASCAFATYANADGNVSTPDLASAPVAVSTVPASADVMGERVIPVKAPVKKKSAAAATKYDLKEDSGTCKGYLAELARLTQHGEWASAGDLCEKACKDPHYLILKSTSAARAFAKTPKTKECYSAIDALCKDVSVSSGAMANVAKAAEKDRAWTFSAGPDFWNSHDLNGAGASLSAFNGKWGLYAAGAKLSGASHSSNSTYVPPTPPTNISASGSVSVDTDRDAWKFSGGILYNIFKHFSLREKVEGKKPTDPKEYEGHHYSPFLINLRAGVSRVMESATSTKKSQATLYLGGAPIGSDSNTSATKYTSPHNGIELGVDAGINRLTVGGGVAFHENLSPMYKFGLSAKFGGSNHYNEPSAKKPAYHRKAMRK